MKNLTCDNCGASLFPEQMVLAFEITSATIVQRRGSDKVSLVTTELSPVFSGGTLCLDFAVSYDCGPDYVRELGVRDNLVEVIRAR